MALNGIPLLSFQWHQKTVSVEYDEEHWDLVLQKKIKRNRHNDNDDDNNNDNNNNNEKMWLFICEGSTKLLTTRIYNNQEKLQVL